ncbi:FAST kinase domain-containing protein 4 isoform X1 [Vespula pensylvanica]|uniref:FAST kinase domain-containing protein 4 isoform X1 n=1 Tax=Vespula pensylvanica TaxID=30213 RepID=UPI001CBA07E6|nr:FAST kinase domain-containing protein 4 isoform X1 [Vespula pensylvanica]
MLPLNSNLFNFTLRTFPYWRLSSLLSTSVVNPETNNIAKHDESVIQDDQKYMKKEKVLKDTKIQETDVTQISVPVDKFQQNILSSSSINEQINQAKNTKDLMSIINHPNLTIDHVKQILNQISNVKTDVEKQNIAKLPTKVVENLSDSYKRKLQIDNNIGFLSLATPKLIQILKRLSYTNERNISLLKALTINITLYSDQLNIRMCGDILYSLAVLNYPEESLLDKIMATLIKEIHHNEYGSVINSIVTSIRLLKYKNQEVLDNIFIWTNNNIEKLRPQDFVAILKCFATFGYTPKNINNLQQYIYGLNQKNVSFNQELWLDYVWSLTILNRVSTKHVSSILNNEFVNSILSKSEKDTLNILKLLNINAAARNILKNYDGPYFDATDKVFSTIIPNKKQKQELVDMLEKTLQEIAPFCFKMNINTKMGFNIDAECCLDSENKFLKYKDNNLKNVKNTRLAIMVHSYHEYSKGEEDILGIIKFYNNLLNAQGYRVLNISYQSFSINDILLKRVKFLNHKINSLQKSVK